jgi:hypothetical protein
MKSQGIPDFQAPPPIPKFIDAVEAVDEAPRTTRSSQRQMSSKRRLITDGTGGVYVNCYFLLHSPIFFCSP